MTMQLPVAEKVLIAPLNWGLGHASRCVPIINGYLKQGAQVHIASNGKALNYLKHRYPQLKSYDLGGSEVNYKGSFLLSILRNVPKLLSQIRNDKAFVRNIQAKENFDFIIADNRYGFSSGNSKSIFIGHQLSLQPSILGFLPSLMLSKYINAFTEVWVPDFKDQTLSGKLSNSTFIKKPVRYVGVLSRFEVSAEPRERNRKQISVILSGPYPSAEEAYALLLPIVLEQRDKNFTVFTSHDFQKEKTPENVAFILNATDDVLLSGIQSSALIIASAGYSTIMELTSMVGEHIPKFLIAKSGQTEQAYLCKHLDGKLGFRVLKKGSQL